MAQNLDLGFESGWGVYAVVHFEDSSIIAQVDGCAESVLNFQHIEQLGFRFADDLGGSFELRNEIKSSQ
jgi:hypothetical protein